MHPKRIGAIVAASLVAILLAMFFGIPGLPGSGGTTVRAAFGADTASAGGYELLTDSQAVSGAPVRVHGVDVGVVTGSALAAGGRSTIVTMHVHGVVPHADASAKIASRTLLGGNLAIEFDPGSPSAPPLADRTIPTSRTSDQITVDQLLEAFPANTRASTRSMLREFRGGFADPTAAATAVTALGSSAPTISAGTKPLLGLQTNDLSSLIRATAATTRALDVNPDVLRGLVVGAERTLAVTDARRGDLQTTISTSPAALDATQAAVRQLDPTLDQLDPLVARLKRAVPELAPAATATRSALQRANTLLTDITPLLRQLGPATTELSGDARQGIPLISQLTPSIERVNHKIIPFLDRLDPATGLKTYEEIGPTFSAAGDAGSLFSPTGHFLLFPDTGDARSIGAAPCTVNSTSDPLVCEQLKQILQTIVGGNS
jgi:ABC-type transporter Mla subunit MlaD